MKKTQRICIITHILTENPNKDYYYILRETGNTEPILVEYGFIDNGKDANKLRNNLKDPSGFCVMNRLKWDKDEGQ